MCILSKTLLMTLDALLNIKVVADICQQCVKCQQYNFNFDNVNIQMI